MTILEWVANHGCVSLTWGEHPSQKKLSQTPVDEERDILIVILAGYLVALFSGAANGALNYQRTSSANTNLYIVKCISNNIVRVDKNLLTQWIRCETLDEMRTFEDRLKKALIGSESVTLDEIYKGSWVFSFQLKNEGYLVLSCDQLF